MKALCIRVFSLLLIFVFLFSGIELAAVAQDEQPPAAPQAGEPGEPPGPGPQQDANGLWFLPGEQEEGLRPTQLAPQASGGPDNYGYTWSDAVPLSWISAGGGTNIPSTAVSLGFNFKFYENTYSQIYLTQYGYGTFNSYSYTSSQSEIPDPYDPNNVVAPHWVPVDFIHGYVRYLRGGVAPNRYFVVEWNKVGTDWDGMEEYTFEMILHENGDIVFQYQTMTYSAGYWCQSSGIEDSEGTDGLAPTNFCNQIAPNHAVRIYRPAPAARLKAGLLKQGSFVQLGETVSFPVTIQNIGDLGTDTYDLSLASGWSAGLFSPNGFSPLTDTDADGYLDTGPLAQAQKKTIYVKVVAPATIVVGASNQATLTIQSSINPAVAKVASLAAGVPAPFSQAYTDYSSGESNLLLAKPDQRIQTKISGDYGDEPTVIEAPNGNFIYVWVVWDCLDAKCDRFGSEIFYSILDHSGNILKAATRLTNHYGATLNTYDTNPSLAVTPSGNIGILWSQRLYNDTSGYSNYNLYFAVLNGSGTLIYSPLNLTNNTSWLSSSAVGYQRFYDPRIAATGDGRFFLGWYRYSREAGGILRDVYYAIRDSNGVQMVGITKLTSGVAGSSYYYFQGLAPLSNNRVWVGMEQNAGGWAASYAVLDSAGTVIKPSTSFGYDAWDLDAVQLSGGKVMVGMTGSGIYFALLDGTTYDIVYGPYSLAAPASGSNYWGLSVTADQAGNGIFTWADYTSSHSDLLYYALLDGNGAILTSPMIFLTPPPAKVGDFYLGMNAYGYANSTNTTPPTTTNVDTFISAPVLIGASPNGTGILPVTFGNKGGTSATSVQVSVTLNGGLTYRSDTSGVAPSVVGNTYTWSLPGSLPFLSQGRFMIYIGMPNVPVGTRLPVPLQISSSGVEAFPADNLFNLEILSARQVNLPVALR